MEVSSVSLVWDLSRQILTLFSWLSAIEMIFLHGGILKQILLSCFPIFQLFWWKNEKQNIYIFSVLLLDYGKGSTGNIWFGEKVLKTFINRSSKYVVSLKGIVFAAGSLPVLEMVFVKRPLTMINSFAYIYSWMC